MKHRSELNIKVRILQRTSQNGGFKKTALMRNIGLSSFQANDYLGELTQQNYLEHMQDGTYAATAKGKAFLNCYATLARDYSDILRCDVVNIRFS